MIASWLPGVSVFAVRSVKVIVEMKVTVAALGIAVGNRDTEGTPVSWTEGVTVGPIVDGATVGTFVDGATVGPNVDGAMVDGVNVGQVVLGTTEGL